MVDKAKDVRSVLALRRCRWWLSTKRAWCAAPVPSPDTPPALRRVDRQSKEPAFYSLKIPGWTKGRRGRRNGSARCADYTQLPMSTLLGSAAAWLVLAGAVGAAGPGGGGAHLFTPPPAPVPGGLGRAVPSLAGGRCDGAWGGVRLRQWWTSLSTSQTSQVSRVGRYRGAAAAVLVRGCSTSHGRRGWLVVDSREIPQSKEDTCTEVWC